MDGAEMVSICNVQRVRAGGTGGRSVRRNTVFWHGAGRHDRALGVQVAGAVFLQREMRFHAADSADYPNEN